MILKRTENLECADCGAKGPRWVSLDFGVFICMNCAGKFLKSRKY
jgi:DNA-directed RNA polymerase subunit RPC12/RpoP